MITKTRLGVIYCMGIISRCLVECCSLIGCHFDVKFHDNWPINKEVNSCQDLFAIFGKIWSNLVTCLILSDILSRKMYIPTHFHRI